ncbi:BON domain-containing protein [Xylophilus sp.]|uniref:BON domain-containing protein n=1 Tax=Xylophilus sp. TaxID=2653893 RepID=UPI0013B9BDDF|nr:BON domain-containing protein [Xylophilus sp.]KAF1049833.1 MAG: hypothetical protein GAK38_00496 [Xylophilus sp.]
MTRYDNNDDPLRRSHGPCVLAVIAVAAAAFGLAGCDRHDNATVGQKVDAAITRTEQAASDAKARAQEAAADAKARTEQAAADAKATYQENAPRVEQSARETNDKIADKVDDIAIKAQVSAGLAKDPDLSALRIDVDAHGGAVTLGGPAPSEQARDRATTIARSIKGVTSVDNRLVVKAGS